MSSASRFSRGRAAAWVAAGLLSGGLAYGLLVLISEPFFAAGGSDLLFLQIEPHPAAQIAACVLVALAVASTGLSRSRAIRRGLALIAAIGFISSGHRIALDGRAAELVDGYFLVPVKRLAYDVDDGLAAQFTLQVGRLHLDLQSRDAEPETHRLFLGLPPWRIDPTPLTLL